MAEAKLFGNRLFVPVDVITVSNVIVKFDAAEDLMTVCEVVEISGARTINRVIDLCSGDAVGVAGIFNGNLTTRGVVLPSRSPVKLINAYSTLCSADNNDISIYYYSECTENSSLVITAKGCLLDAFATSVGSSGGNPIIAATMRFFIAGITITEETGS